MHGDAAANRITAEGLEALSSQLGVPIANIDKFSEYEMLQTIASIPENQRGETARDYIKSIKLQGTTDGHGELEIKTESKYKAKAEGFTTPKETAETAANKK
jgi:hypothetical protein